MNKSLPPGYLAYIATRVGLIDAALTAAVHGRGLDGNGQALPRLEQTLAKALQDLVDVGEFTRRALTGES